MKKIENISLKKETNRKENIILLLKGKKKSLPTQYLYDDTGSKLFEEICETEEYYLTRTEHKILNSNASNIIKTSSAEELFEFGSGSSKKTKTLILSALKRNNHLTYFSFDISSKALTMSYNELSKISENLNVRLLKGDFKWDINRKKKKKKKKTLFVFRQYSR
mgnify:CR=1 FL=1